MRLWLIGVAAAMLAGTFARITCLGAEFWLDEIWSLALAREAGSPLGVFLATKHDNNHHLNTLFLFFCPDGIWWGWYRLLSLIAGVLAIGAAALAARRWGRIEALIAAWLVAGCSWLILASAEARGYSLAILFALIAFAAMGDYLQTRSRRSLAIYWLATVAGFLSHLTFIHATIGFVVWSLRRFARERKSSGDEIRQLLITHGVPGLIVVLFYLVAVRGMDKGGGPPAATFDVLTSLIGCGLGGPVGWWSSPWCVVAMTLFLVGVMRLRDEGDDSWVFFVACCVASPGLYLIARPPYLFERYFFIPFVFFLLLVAQAAGGARGNHVERVPSPDRGIPLATVLANAVVFALVAVFLGGNAFTVWRFVESGRGDFRESLAWIAAQQDEVITVRAEEPQGATFRVKQYLNFYGPRVAPTHEILFSSADRRIAEWMLVHRLPQEPIPEDFRFGYRLVQSFPSRGPWAWGWFVYRRVKEPDIREQ